MIRTPRPVNFATKLQIFKKKPISMIFGFLFTLIPLIICTVSLIAFSVRGKNESKINYDQVREEGRKLTATITNLEVQENVTINDVHPTIIYYKYSDDNNIVESSNKVLEQDRIANLAIGDQINIIELDGQSIIKDLNPYNFSYTFLIYLLLPFSILGFPFLFYSIYHFKKELKLYQYGTVSKAKLISMIPNYSIRSTNVGKGLNVQYEYKSKRGNTLVGESTTTDYSIMNEFKQGDLIPIFVSPQDETKSTVVPKLQSYRNNWRIDF